MANHGNNLCNTDVLRVESLPEADKIMILPGQPQVSFQQFGGYVTVDEQEDRALFYYFAEAETDPSSKPLVLWLNEGPGCSSIGVGAFCEHGPFKPTEHVLVKNDYSWNKGVGFSYSANKSFYASVTDDMTAQDNLVFLEHWFNKFPEYKNRDFYITGVMLVCIISIRHYGPQLAQLIIQSKMKFNLKGIALRNPLLEFSTDFNSRAEYLWSHGLISDATYELFTNSQTDTLTPICSGVNNPVSREIGKFIDKYDVTLDVCSSFRWFTSTDTKNIDVCVEDETVTYLNREDVQKAFHAWLVGVTAWSVYSTVLHYEKKNLEIPTIHVLGSLVKSGIRVLVFSGDEDSVIPLLGTCTLVNELAKELELKTTVPYRVWFEGRQVTGWTQVYGDILSFATIRGAAHEAPFSQPERLLVLFNSFLGGNPPPEAVLSTESI
ncbi:hypothetical protein CsSME_00045985 [Camellia sinensis var. sinensis]